MNNEIDKHIRAYLSHLAQDELSEAQREMLETINLIENKYGLFHEKLLPTIELLAGLLWCTDRQSEAQTWVERATKIRLQFLARESALN